MNKLSSDTDFEALFGIDLAPGADPAADASGIICGKCSGSGKFVGYTGRVVGDCFACKGTGVHAVAMGTAPVTHAVDVSAIATAFAAAFAAGVTRPKLRLADFVFSRAPDNGRNAGAIYAKKGDTYLGKIAGGAFSPSRDCDAETAAQVVAVAASPADAATAYGFRTGSCSCCGRTLTNKLSIDLGIGPICRERYGWGG